ncbi:hypothetical protein ACFYXS_37415 [Streptomyces sp. NPDC002574]|uniref:hypothetical protein n=1 Tax=Streptomyces sp. NPDC002574 TaxID=3364652 RepID=UPI0036B6F3BC
MNAVAAIAVLILVLGAAVTVLVILPASAQASGIAAGIATAGFTLAGRLAIPSKK